LGRVIVVTGATSGLGRAAALAFAARGDRVVLVGRDEARGTQVQEQIRAAGGTADLVVGDVSTRAGIAAVAVAIRSLTHAIDVLVNNAGGRFDVEQKTVDGLEGTFALNTWAPYLLERALHAELAAARGRVVNVTTGFLDWYPVDVDDLVAPRAFDGMTQYARCKHAAVMMSVEQAQRRQKDGIRVVSLNPGIIMGTGFGGGQGAVTQAVVGPMMRLFGVGCTLEEAVRRFEVACFDDVPTGSHLVKGAPAELPKQARDAEVRARVMALLDSLA
jgi:NAD(P)-dependent dehydrogenase (short-subunit alcohol dehydrogenase family)